MYENKTQAKLINNSSIPPFKKRNGNGTHTALIGSRVEITRESRFPNYVKALEDVAAQPIQMGFAGQQTGYLPAHKRVVAAVGAQRPVYYKHMHSGHTVGVQLLCKPQVRRGR